MKSKPADPVKADSFVRITGQMRKVRENIRRYNSGDLMSGTTIKYPIGECSFIVVVKRAGDWHATINGRSGFGVGQTPSEAVGDLLIHHIEKITLAMQKK